MSKKRSRFAPAVWFANEALESRLVMTASPLHQGAAQVAAAHGSHSTATHMTLAVSAGTLGQPITFTATVRASASAGSPKGSVTIFDRGQAVASLPVAPTSSPDPRYAYSQGTVTLTTPAGGIGYFFGKHSVTARFTPLNGVAKSTGHATFTVNQPAYKTLSGGVKVATIASGTGPQIQSGQKANMLYTGYLAKGGKVFDDSLAHGGKPFSFKVGAGQVVPGFDTGTLGMQVGESRIIQIPPSQGYGNHKTGPIPANSTLVFVVTLDSIS